MKLFFYFLKQLKKISATIAREGPYFLHASIIKKRKKKNEVVIYTLPHSKRIRLVSVRSSLPCINIGMQIKLTKKRVNDKML